MLINKFISQTGYCSRRQAERLIEAGFITVNGKICLKGDVVEPGDVVLINGEPIPQKTRPVYLALNKPVGITCTSDPTVKSNIIDFVDYPERIFAVGRLDKDSHGLILLTNDGDIVNKMMRSENYHEKEYIVKVDKYLSDSFIEQMGKGVDILGTTTKPCQVFWLDDYKFRIILTQGLNRQIRRMCKVFGYRVVDLQRIRIMNIKLGNFETGSWRELSELELKHLLSMLNGKLRGE